MLKSDKWIRSQCTDQLKFTITKCAGFNIINNSSPFIASKMDNWTEDAVKTILLNSEELNGFSYFVEKFKEITNFKITRTDTIGEYYFIIKVDYKNSVINTDPMISPFVGKSIKVDKNNNKIPSYGLSSYGYDIRLGRNLKVFKNLNQDNNEIVVTKKNSTQHVQTELTDIIVDPCDFNPNLYQEFKDVDEVIIPPGGFVLGHTVEYFNMPRRVMGICMGKSTLARCGIDILVTPLEPGWSGYLTLEIVNVTKLPIRLKTETGICQINFLESDEDCEVSYADRGGKYQNQPKIPVDPKV